MNVLLPLGIIIVVICFFCRNNNNAQNFSLFLAFIALALFLIFRFGFGPDYYNYWNIFDSIQGADASNHTGDGSTVEVGFLKYMQLFPNYALFVAFNSLLWIITSYWLCKKYANPNMYWFVLLMLMFDPNTLTHHAVAMRQALCCVLFVIAFEFLNRGKIFVFCAIIIFASSFHTSALLLLLIGFVYYDKKDFLTSNVYIYLIIGSGILSVLLGDNIVLKILRNFLLSNVEELQRYQDYEIGTTSSITALLFRLMLVTILLYVVSATKKDTDERYIYFNKVAIMAISIQLFFGQVLLSDRLLMSLTPFLVIAMSRFSRYMPKTFTYISFSFVIGIAFYLLSIKMGKTYAISFLEYRTIFEAPYIP